MYKEILWTYDSLQEVLEFLSSRKVPKLLDSSPQPTTNGFEVLLEN